MLMLEGLESVFFGRFLLGLSRIKHPQVMSMVKFGPRALNFGYDFVLLVIFLGHHVGALVHSDIFIRFISYLVQSLVIQNKLFLEMQISF